MNKKLLILAVIGLVLVVSLGAGYYLGYQKGYGRGVETGRAALKSTAGSVVGNPLEKMPNANPFEKVANPFEAGYVNPFK